MDYTTKVYVNLSNLHFCQININKVGPNRTLSIYR